MELFHLCLWGREFVILLDSKINDKITVLIHGVKITQKITVLIHNVCDSYTVVRYEKIRILGVDSDVYDSLEIVCLCKDYEECRSKIHKLKLDNSHYYDIAYPWHDEMKYKFE